MSKTDLRGAIAVLFLMALLFVSGNAGNAAPGQKKTVEKGKNAPVTIRLRDLDYEKFRAAHPSNAFLGTILPALSGGKTEKRSFRLTGKSRAVGAACCSRDADSLRGGRKAENAANLRENGSAPSPARAKISRLTSPSPKPTQTPQWSLPCPSVRKTRF